MKFLDYLLLERNIINLDTVDALIAMVLKDLKDATAVTDITSQNFKKMEKWIRTNYKNFILRDYEPVTKLSPTDSYVTSKIKDNPWIQKAIDRGDELNALIVTHYIRDDIAHVIDYFLANQNVNISRMSVPEAIRQSKEWTLALNKKAAGEEDPTGIKVVRKYPDGFVWVNVLSSQSLDREGKLMRHCVGSYCDRVSSGLVDIYSLRDKKNEPHCTVEVIKNEIVQMQGKSNGPVDKKYLKYCKDFIMKPVAGSKWSSVDDMALEKVNLIELAGKYKEVDKLNNNDKKILVNALIDMIFAHGHGLDLNDYWAIEVIKDLDLEDASEGLLNQKEYEDYAKANLEDKSIKLLIYYYRAYY